MVQLWPCVTATVEANLISASNQSSPVVPTGVPVTLPLPLPVVKPNVKAEPRVISIRWPVRVTL